MASHFIHPTSIIDENVIIGHGTKIWHFCHISEGAIIGNNCILGQNVFVGRNVQIGDSVKIQNNVSVYEGIYIMDDVFIGPSVVFTNVRYPRATIEQKDKFEVTSIKTGVTIGANATILCGITIEAYAMIGAGAVVTKDVPAFALVMGNPAKVVGRVGYKGKPNGE